MAILTHADLLMNRRTKIVATVGPASSSPDMLVSLMEAGVNVFRLNMSHGDHAAHETACGHIREISDRSGVPVAVLADLCGPKIRTGTFEEGGIDLVEGEEVTITTERVQGRAGLISSQYEALAGDVQPGDRILLADGLFELSVVASHGADITCEVIHGGRLTDNKGMNLPGVAVSAPCMTGKDIADARFALELGVDYIALSFVRRPEDVEQLRGMFGGRREQPAIVAKIEKPEALENAEAILSVTDAIMIARGDLGVELPPEEVPSAQQQLITMSRQQGKPVIVATQMLESMITNSRPTRAEVTDVSHAVTSGADAVMLSAETAAGEFPLEAVEMMDRVARQAEAHLWSSGAWGAGTDRHDNRQVWHSVASATARMSRELGARAVIVVSRSGISAQIISSARPAAPVVVVTSERRTYNRLSLVWGVLPILNEKAGRENPNELAREVALELKLASSGQYLLLVRGFHDERALNLPSVTVITV